MSFTKPVPLSLREWVQSIAGPVQSVRDVSSDRLNSQVWELICATQRVFVKLAPTPKFFGRETRALREVAPSLEPGTVPLLLAADPHQMALLLSPVVGRPAKSLPLTPADQCLMHRQAGSWLSRFHGGPGDLSARDRRDAAAELAHAVAGAEKHLATSGNLISPQQRRTVQWHVAELGQIGPLPAGYVHGDFQESNWLVKTSPSGSVFGAVDLERARPHAVVADVVHLACGSWLGRPDLEEAFWDGYGRVLTDAEKRALHCLSALDAVSAIAWDVPTGDREIVDRGRAALARLEVQTA
ncbi:phosphotransferase [Streptomyces chartreusis]